jgi:hypothetical protein
METQMKKIVFLSLLLIANIAVAKLSFVTTTHPGQWLSVFLFDQFLSASDQIFLNLS